MRALGFEGQAVEPGEWGRLVNGGAALTVEGERVDLLYRDLEVVEHWRAEAEVSGRFEVDRVEGYVAGMATYVLAGGSLPWPKRFWPASCRAPRSRSRLRETAPSPLAGELVVLAGHVAEAIRRTGAVCQCRSMPAHVAAWLGRHQGGDDPEKRGE